MPKCGTKGFNPLSKKASGVAADPTVNVTYRGTMFPEINGRQFAVPRLNGSGKAQREYIEKQHRQTLEEQDARDAAQEARQELAATRQELKALRTEVTRLRADAAATVQMLLTAASVDKERAETALTAALNSAPAPGQIPVMFTSDEIAGWLERVEQRQQAEQAESDSSAES